MIVGAGKAPIILAMEHQENKDMKEIIRTVVTKAHDPNARDPATGPPLAALPWCTHYVAGWLPGLTRCSMCDTSSAAFRAPFLTQ